MKVEDYFEIFGIKNNEDQKKRFLGTLFEKARQWTSTIEIDKLNRYTYKEDDAKAEK